MTYNDWREYGYRSRLSEVMRMGGYKPPVDQQRAVAARATDQGVFATDQAQAMHWRGLEMQLPFINQQTALAGGDRGQATAAVAGQVADLSRGWDASKQSVMNSIGPGAGRDRILADLAAKRYSATSGYLADAVRQAPLNLAQLGQSRLGYAQGLEGAGTGYLGAATNANKSVADMQYQQHQSAMAPWLGLASLAGAALGGGLGKTLTSGIGKLFQPQTVGGMPDSVFNNSITPYMSPGSLPGQSGTGYV